MSTKNQILQGSRKTIKSNIPCPNKRKVLINKPKPQIRGVCLKVLTIKPKKPNSAQRKIAKVKLSNGSIVIVYLPGVGHTLIEHSVILVKGGKTQDLPGLKYKAIRGKFDFKKVENRKTSKTKYGG